MQGGIIETIRIGYHNIEYRLRINS